MINLSAAIQTARRPPAGAFHERKTGLEPATPTLARAVAAGATVVFPIADQPYGMRQGRVADRLGITG